jgi:hypothetical protein
MIGSKTYQWAMTPDKHMVLCFQSVYNTQIFGGALLTASLSNFHDEELATATAEINKILAAAERTNPGKDLAFLETPRGFLLAWCGRGVSYESDEQEVLKFLRLKKPKARKKA